MTKMKTESIWWRPKNRFYNFLKYTDKFNLKKNLLVIGCSDGTYVIPAAKKGFYVVALDIDKEAICGLKKRIDLEGDVLDKIEYVVCDYMNYETNKKFPLIFTSGSIHYENNNVHNFKKMIFKMLNMLEENGVLLLEYIHKSYNTDKNRYFITKEELNKLLSEYDGIKIISHKVKKYIEGPNPRDDSLHNITWGRAYIQKKSIYKS